MTRHAAGCAALLGLLVMGTEAADPWRRHNIRVDRDTPAGMRDGVTLYADVYRPIDEGRYPALLMRTPYNKEADTDDFYVAAAKRGYVVAVQDVRGQFRSEGTFDPYLQEITDGYDSIEWLAAQPYANGKVGTFGISYRGAVQWMTAPARPPHLVAMVPAMTFANARHFTYHGGIFVSPILNWLMQRQVKARRERGLPYPTIDEVRAAVSANRDEWLHHLPLRDLPVMRDFPVWRDWVDHADNGPYWAPYDIEAQHAKVKVPAMNVTAWNDDDYGQPGAIRNFTGMRARGGSDAARRGQRLLIGPWTHGKPTLGRTAFAGIEFGPNAAFDYNEALFRYFDYWLKGVDDGYSAEAPVRYFVMGDNVWREAQDWPPPGTTSEELYLAEAGRLQRTVPAHEATERFTYDPRNPIRLPGDGLIYASGPRTTDWRIVTARRDVAVFTTEPLARDTEITGQILARVWISSTAPDTDVSMRLLDVAPDGSTRNFTVAPGMLRTRYRSTEREATAAPLRPGEPVELEINLGYTSYVVPAGHRLQAYVGGSVYPYIHLNTWEPFVSWSQARPATQTVHLGARYRSRIVVPTRPRAASSDR
jgi:putative CocE/NonD family hydrolase